METREELIEKLGYAVDIMRRAEKLGQQLKNMKTSIFWTDLKAKRSLMPYIGKGPLIFWGLIIFFFIIFEIEDMLGQNDIIGAVFFYMQMNAGVQIVSFLVTVIEIGLGLGITIPIVLLIRKISNKQIDKKNESIKKKIEQNKEELQGALEQGERLLQRMEQVQMEYNQYVAPWYPAEYSYLSVAEYLYDVVRNGRADSMKEALNLYENWKHQQEMEKGMNNLLQGQMMQTIMMRNAVDSLTGEVNRLREDVRYYSYY